MSLTELQLQIEKAGKLYGVSAELIERDDLFFQDYVLRLVKRFVTFQWAESNVKVPATWRDHFAAKWRAHYGLRGRLARRLLAEPRYITYRAMEVLPNFPELDKFRHGDRIAMFVQNYEDDSE